MENLCNDVLENILFRLPLGTTSSQAKRVRKSWKAILSNRPHNEAGYLFACHDHTDDLKVKDGKIQLYFGEKYDHIDCNKMNYYYSDETLMEMEHCRFVFKSYPYYDILVGSCNGLVCFQKEDPGDNVHEPFAICNPLTGEFISLKANVSRVHCTRVSSGFGYCHSTGEYKVVRLYSVSEEQHVSYAQVYTIGSNKWRDMEAFIDRKIYFAYGISANGFLHWLADDAEADCIVFFDLEDENFGELPLLPPQAYEDEDSNPCQELKLLGGNLCWAKRNFTGMDIWAYKKKNPNTESDEKRDYYSKHSWNWVREFSIEYREWYESPFAITESNQVLMLSVFEFYCYDSETQTISNQRNDRGMDQVIPHANSYVSLKDFGETWYGPGSSPATSLLS